MITRSRWESSNVVVFGTVAVQRVAQTYGAHTYYLGTWNANENRTDAVGFDPTAPNPAAHSNNAYTEDISSLVDADTLGHALTYLARASQG